MSRLYETKEEYWKGSSLLPDTKLGKNIIQLILRGHLPEHVQLVEEERKKIKENPQYGMDREDARKTLKLDQ